MRRNPKSIILDVIGFEIPLDLYHGFAERICFSVGALDFDEKLLELMQRLLAVFQGLVD